jgi:pseudomonalisin
MLAAPETPIGQVDPQFRMDRMVLLLQPSAAQQQMLDALAAAQQDEGSPLFHQWLTPADYADFFGIPADEATTIASWLVSHGFHVDEIPASRRMIVFSGTAGAIDTAFHTQMMRYTAHGEERIANSNNPVIPAEFAEEIGGIAGLHNQRSAPQHTPVAEFAAGPANYLAPADLATIYDIAPLYARSATGADSAIAVLARSNLLPGDIAAFRDAFGLPQNPPTVIVNGPDPGIVNQTDLEETELDVEWAGAIAPQAAIDVVASASTQTIDGILLSAEYAVDHNVAPIIALSYGECEAHLGFAENAMLAALWEQAAVEGITVVVAAGDAGAADCDDPAAFAATQGRGVNGMCSTPWSLCVGGTEFADEKGRYWSIDSSTNGESALGYIPETAWNESGTPAGGLWAGGGGSSQLYARPSWQPGSAATRRVPDVAFSSASHDAYLVWLNGAQVADSGTSAATQVMAGIAALLGESEGERLGTLGPVLYGMAPFYSAAFHDIVTGNDSVPGVAGFKAIPGYDEATGLGSIDAAELARALRLRWRAPARCHCAPEHVCRPAPIRPRSLP